MQVSLLRLEVILFYFAKRRRCPEGHKPDSGGAYERNANNSFQRSASAGVSLTAVETLFRIRGPLPLVVASMNWIKEVVGDEISYLPAQRMAGG